MVSRMIQSVMVGVKQNLPKSLMVHLLDLSPMQNDAIWSI